MLWVTRQTIRVNRSATAWLIRVINRATRSACARRARRPGDAAYPALAVARPGDQETDHECNDADPGHSPDDRDHLRNNGDPCDRRGGGTAALPQAVGQDTPGSEPRAHGHHDPHQS